MHSRVLKDIQLNFVDKASRALAMANRVASPDTTPSMKTTPPTSPSVIALSASSSTPADSIIRRSPHARRPTPQFRRLAREILVERAADRVVRPDPRRQLRSAVAQLGPGARDAVVLVHLPVGLDPEQNAAQRDSRLVTPYRSEPLPLARPSPSRAATPSPSGGPLERRCRPCRSKRVPRWCTGRCNRTRR